MDEADDRRQLVLQPRSQTRFTQRQPGILERLQYAMSFVQVEDELLRNWIVVGPAADHDAGAGVGNLCPGGAETASGRPATAPVVEPNRSSKAASTVAAAGATIPPPWTR